MAAFGARRHHACDSMPTQGRDGHVSLHRVGQKSLAASFLGNEHHFALVGVTDRAGRIRLTEQFDASSATASGTCEHGEQFAATGASQACYPENLAFADVERDR